MSRIVRYFLPLLAVLLATMVYGQKYSERGHVRKGNRLYESQRMEESQREYRSALQEEPLMVEGKFNLGDAQFAMGDFESAENTFKDLLGNPNLTPEVKAKTHYNIGNAQFQQQKLEEALESYKSSLKLNPSDMEAKFNYAYTKALLENQQNEDNQQNKDNQQNNQQNQDNQQQQQPEGQQDDKQNEDQQNNGQNDEQQQQQPEGEKPEPSEQPESGEQPQPRPESEQMLNAVQAAEDKTRDKVDAERVVGVGRSGKNW